MQEVPQWIQAGGVVAFGGLVIVILRQLVPVMAALVQVLIELKVMMSALLERERARSERIAAREAAAAAAAAAPATTSVRIPQAIDPFDEEDTHPIALPPKRARTNPGVASTGAYHLRKDER